MRFGWSSLWVAWEERWLFHPGRRLLLWRMSSRNSFLRVSSLRQLWPLWWNTSPGRSFLTVCCHEWLGSSRATEEQWSARTPGCHCSHQDGPHVYPGGIRPFSPCPARAFLPALLTLFSLPCSPPAAFSSAEWASLCPFPWQDMNERSPADNPRNFFSGTASSWLKVFFSLWMEEVNNSPDGLDEGAVCKEWAAITRLNLNIFLLFPRQAFYADLSF